MKLTLKQKPEQKPMSSKPDCANQTDSIYAIARRYRRGPNPLAAYS